MKRLIIIGASGHGKVVADIATLNGYNEILFLDDNESIKECAGWPVIGKSRDALEGEIFVAIGNAETRKNLMEYYSERVQPSLIHPSAFIANGTKLDKGSVVMAGAIINPGVKIGRGCIINTSSSVDHDCIVEDYCHISVGAHLCGTVIIGESTWIGAGAIISNNVDICAGCLIGAGAVVISNITVSGTYFGVPARRYRKKD